MSIGTLPQTLKVGGRDWRIRTDFRDILKIFEAMNDRELEHEEKIYTMLYILYPDLEKMPVRLYQEAAEQANWFIDAGTQDDEGENVRKMDWTQDEPIIFPAVNAVAGTKKLEGKTLDKWEKEFYQKNKKICDLIVEKTEQEKQEEQEINNLLG